MKVEINKVAEFAGHSGSIYGLYACYNQGIFYTGGADGYIVQWHVDKPEEGKLIARLSSPVYCLLWDEQTGLIWAGTGSGHIHIIDLNNGKEVKNLAIHQKGVFDLKIADDCVYAAGGEGGISRIDRKHGECLAYVKVSEQSVRVLAIDSATDKMAYGSSDKSIGLLTKNLEFKKLLSGAHTSSVFSLVFSPDGQYLLSGGRDAMLYVRDGNDPGKVYESIPAHNLHIHCLSWNPHQPLFLSSSMDKTIKLWDAGDFSLIKVIDFQRYGSHLNSINKVAWLSEDSFVSVSDDKKAMIFSLKT